MMNVLKKLESTSEKKMLNGQSEKWNEREKGLSALKGVSVPVLLWVIGAVMIECMIYALMRGVGE